MFLFFFLKSTVNLQNHDIAVPMGARRGPDKIAWTDKNDNFFDAPMVRMKIFANFQTFLDSIKGHLIRAVLKFNTPKMSLISLKIGK